MRRAEPPILAIALLAAAAAAGTPAGAAQPEQRLKEVESAIERGHAERQELERAAEALAAELSALRKDMVAAARKAQEHETRLSELESRLAELEKLEADNRRTLDKRREQMIGILTAVQRLAWRPSEALIGQPTSPADTVRSAILLRAALPAIEQAARDLRKEVEDLAELRSDIAARHQEVAATTAELQGERRRLTALAERKAELHRATRRKEHATERRLAALAAEAEDLRDLLRRLEAEREQRERDEKLRREQQPKDSARPPAPRPPERPFSAAMGELPLPASGKIVARYGEPTELGTTHRGLSVATRDGAQVVAPYDGMVAFAGPFRGYGQLLIIEHGEGYHTLLAGMARIDSAVGQRLVAGEPVGVMGQSEGVPTLYFELRRHGQPINPMPWLTARKHKVSG